ncbi:hypothetical protein GCM10010435_41060 [Winogradskya consettensis]|uniref:WXG100 family type VII secretion target n=1 Tax=Winogradskya consettensis TaxID=113560 RepID=A0A919SDM3_9ACTN|nr:hypothetical protein [Actinoplanes consettensis]GIM69815.1 hypothetical protein Aco04nite_17190 [Actinoplanes consettensis]
MPDRVLSVDPEALIGMAQPYHSAAEVFQQLEHRAQTMLARYQGAWGDDDIGAQVDQHYRQVLTMIADSAGSVRSDLVYHGDGLRTTGKVFAAANEHAEQSSAALAAAFVPLEGHAASAAEVSQPAAELPPAG